MTEFFRSHMCGTLEEKHVGETVELIGWVASKRDFGDLTFVYLRDVTGRVQVVFNALGLSEEDNKTTSNLKFEYVIKVKGKVVKRAQNAFNPAISTGKIEVEADSLEVVNSSDILPFMLEGKNIGNETLRLEHRYLDIRRDEIKNNLVLRSNISRSIRNYLGDEHFVEVETPMLGKSTPEGARDYLVPSRVNKGKFYALPQSPQLYKQLLMIGGLDRYYQIAKCFRDEDLRADRQPEFTQVDIEMSFVTQEDVLNMSEQLVKKVFEENSDVKVKTPFKRLTYKEAMNKYGSDKPDLRFGLELVDITDLVEDSEAEMFSAPATSGGSIKVINAKGLNDKISRKYFDKLTSTAKLHKAKGLASIRMTEEGINTSLTKFLVEEEIEAIVERTEAEIGDMLLIVANEKPETACKALGAVRLQLAEKFELIDKNEYNFSWVVDFPMFEYSEEDGRYYSSHHPFTMPKKEHLHMLETNPAEVLSDAYDMVINGQEAGGGSVRISDNKIQEKVFETLSFTKEEIKEQFGFFVDAFNYGTPPHGGIAFGLDRLVMLLAKTENIKDVIAFPKIQTASCLMTKAPSIVSEAQLEELALKIDLKEE